MNAATAMLDRLTSDRPALIRRQSEADRVVRATSAGHLVHEMNLERDRPHGGPWRVDPIPLVLDGPTFDRLAAGVSERMQMLEGILADLYGARRLVADGVVPGEALSSTSRYRTGSVGMPAPQRWLTTYAVDVVQLGDGTWRIVRDLTDAPTGIGYAILDRAAMLPVDDDVASLTGVGAALRRALAANTSVVSPRIVLLSGGVEHDGYVEDSQLARLLGFTLIERPDVVVRQGRLWLRTLGEFDPIDVVYRRVDDHETDPIELAAPGGGGVPGVLSAVASGGVVLANAHGCGLVEDDSLAQYWPAAAAALTGSSPRLPQLGEAARTANFETFPVFRGGELGDAAVVLRLHAVAGPGGVTVVPGGNGRVLEPGDDPARPSARIVKDVWVLDRRKSLPAVVTPLPQVDLARSVPTRAADALFWMGRAAERAEAIARMLRVVAARRRQDPMLTTVDEGRWSTLVAAALRSLGNIDSTAASAERQRSPVVDLDAAVAAVTKKLGRRLRTFVAEAASVGEFLPGGTARVLTNSAALVDTFAGGQASMVAIEDVLDALAAFAGRWNESTVRGPAWRFGDIGVRLERSLVVLGLVRALSPGPGVAQGASETADVVALDVLLAANESLVAYRRQHRSDIAAAPALHLLLRDRDNPRGLAMCLDRIAEHVADVGWPEGATMVHRLTSGIDAETSPEDERQLLGDTATALARFADKIVDRWFATPVKPMLMRAGRAAGK